MQKIPKVLFLSTGNSTRSQMAEGFLRTLAGEYFQPVSAGIEPGNVEQLAVEVMREFGIDISRQKPKSVSESFKDNFGHVVVVYDPGKERPPIFPFTRKLLRWSLPDPSAAQGSRDEQKEVFRRVRDEIQRKTQDFVNAEKRQERPAIAA
jgi:arsenate reductase (thioredoxin)